MKDRYTADSQDLRFVHIISMVMRRNLKNISGSMDIELPFHPNICSAVADCLEGFSSERVFCGHGMMMTFEAEIGKRVWGNI